MKGKKFISVFLSALLLSSCTLTSRTSETSADPRRQNTDETVEEDSGKTTVVETTEAEETEPTEKTYKSLYDPAPWSIEETVAYDKDSIKITAMELVQENEQVAGLAMWVENDYSTDLVFTVPALYINDILSYSFFSSDEILVEKGDKKLLMAAIYIPALEAYGITEISRLGVSVSGTNNANYEVFTSDVCDIDTDYDGEMQEPDLSILQLAATNEVMDVYVDTWTGSKEQKVMEIFFRNKTDESLKVSTTSIIFNGETEFGQIYNYLPAKKSWDYYYLLDDDYITSHLPGDKVVHSVTLQFGYKKKTESDFAWVSEPFTIEVE